MVRACHDSCRTVLEKAATEGLIRVNPSLGCKLPPKKAKEMEVLNSDEMQRFLIQAKEEGYYELFLLELGTGMRRGEILALHWGDLDFKTGELHISRQVYTVKGELLISTPKTKSSVRTWYCHCHLSRCLRNTERRWALDGCFRRLSRRILRVIPEPSENGCS